MTRLTTFIETLRRHGTRTCIEDGDASHTYDDLLKRIEGWQLQFDTLDLNAGAVVGIRADYSLPAIAALLALLLRGSVAALIPRDRDVGGYLTDAHASALLTVNADGTHELQPQPSPERHPLLDQLRRQGDGGLVIFTSGSTGRPKAALQGCERFLSKFARPGRCLRTLAFLLFDHIAGMDTLFYTLASGGTLVLTRKRDPSSILDIIEAHRVEVLPTSPSFLRLLCAAGGLQQRDLSSLEVITYGSEPMDPSTLVRVRAIFPAAQISQKYGTTETGSPRSVSRGDDSLWLRIKSTGAETKIVDDVLWIRSEGTMLGYLNAPSPVDTEGWYCTGDLVDVDGEWIRFRGRAADIINVGGEKVSPAEVERAIHELDFVREVAVCGEPHPLMGQVVTARVGIQSGLESREVTKAIRKHCRARLAPHKVPVRIELTTEPLANERQKLKRHRAAD